MVGPPPAMTVLILYPRQTSVFMRQTVIDYRAGGAEASVGIYGGGARGSRRCQWSFWMTEECAEGAPGHR